ncbi:hypothetical protein F2P81_020292 [Scophthalmus maximus]|uniref:Uncharacterized protein n=1 Tax=Scophthalmus maximus TaxID=52904 RepID=A0A6A4S8Y4_SCOMX|nr:hypothetical protein F2P81_020292 [Scophthalmus maximus]
MTSSQRKCRVFVTASVGGVEHHSAACTSVRSLACQSGLGAAMASVAWHPPLALASDQLLWTASSPLAADMLLNHPLTHSWTASTNT